MAEVGSQHSAVAQAVGVAAGERKVVGALLTLVLENTGRVRADVQVLAVLVPQLERKTGRAVGGVAQKSVLQGKTEMTFLETKEHLSKT